MVVTLTTVKTSFWCNDRASCIDDVTSTTFCPGFQFTSRCNAKVRLPGLAVAERRDHV